MDARRARAYGRVIRALEAAPPGAISPEQQRTLREAADALVFARAHGDDVRGALAGARQVLLALRRPAHGPWGDQLAADLEDSGPARSADAATPAWAPVPSLDVERTRRRADT